jgi:ATP-dependent Clp protease ATP-binding subunit ClpB
LKRFIQHEVETALARRILRGEVPDGSTVTMTADGDELRFDVVGPPSGESTEDAPVEEPAAH